MTNENKCYSVYVGGGEINDYYLTRKEARELAKIWRARGYDDTAVVKMF